MTMKLFDSHQFNFGKWLRQKNYCPFLQLKNSTLPKLDLYVTSIAMFLITMLREQNKSNSIMIFAIGKYRKHPRIVECSFVGFLKQKNKPCLPYCSHIDS